MDRFARGFVSLGGAAVILSILAILIVIVAEVLPLFSAPRLAESAPSRLATTAPTLALDVDEHRTLAVACTATGLQILPLTPEAALPEGAAVAGAALREALGAATVTAASPCGNGALALGLSDGRVQPLRLRFPAQFRSGRRTIDVAVELLPAFPGLPDGRPVEVLAHVADERRTLTALADGPRTLALLVGQSSTSLTGETTRRETRRAIELPIQGEIRALALDSYAEELYIGTSCGRLVLVDVRKPKAPKFAGTVRISDAPSAAVTCLTLLIGHRTVVAGDSAGGVSTWQVLRNAEEVGQLARVHEFSPHAQAVTAIAPCRRNKGFLSADASGAIHLHFGTTGVTLLRVAPGNAAVHALAYAPKADGFLAATGDGDLRRWDLHNPHPEITLGSLFGKVQYEGYPAPDHTWQSSSGSDDFEPKFGLTPLLYGTLKGTFYALVFAVPLALLGALYASQFMHPRLRHTVKPVIEIMAALPSVVLGFLAGLWLAPAVEKILPGVFLTLLVVPAVILAAVFAWRRLPLRARGWLRPGTEIVVLVPIVLAGVWLSIAIGYRIEEVLLRGEARVWLREVLGLTYDQRNSVVVGFAMGFAVIPIIFTIAEDSITNVPPSLSAGSLALGATPWQTVLNVVLPAASPGIFSAIMVGFGRAVGETMIVLMATGNTPVMDPSPFNGFRALSANIAVELPEAAEGSSHFRVLFLAALLLFAMTFCVNTVAEVIRQRLRRRYTLR